MKNDTSQINTSKKHSSIIPSLLSLLSPGMGQIYNGQAKKGFAIYFSGFVFGFAFYLLGGTFNGLSLVCFSLAILYLYSFFQANSYARNSESRTPKKYNRWYFYILWYLVVVILSSFLTDFIKSKFEAFKIPASSMEPSIQVGDHIIVDKTNPTKFKNNDIVVFTLPEKPNFKIIKRIIASGEQVVELDGKNLYIDGELRNERFVKWSYGGGSNFKAQKVPPGMVFLLGDNRDKSRDSRFWKSPFVSAENIIGKAKYVYWNPLKPLERLGVSFK